MFSMRTVLRSSQKEERYAKNALMIAVRRKLRYYAFCFSNQTDPTPLLLARTTDADQLISQTKRAGYPQASQRALELPSGNFGE
jgi:hypothetical protein